MIGKIIAFIFGSIMGSFLNVCIHRMPQGKSVVWPHSHCSSCEKKIPWHDNIPFISYMLLRGRCRFCKQKISPRYIIVELLTAWLFVALYQHFGLGFEFFFYVLFVGSLIIATFVDIQHRIIPDEVSIGGMIIGFLLNTARGINIQPLSFNFWPMLNSLLGIITGAAIIYLTGLAFDLVYFRLLRRPPIQGETESMGFGDVKLLAMIGAFLGWQRALVTFFLAPLFGVVVGIINLIVKKDHTIPYGPFLSLGAIISLFWMNKIISFIIFVR